MNRLFGGTKKDCGHNKKKNPNHFISEKDSHKHFENILYAFFCVSSVFSYKFYRGTNRIAKYVANFL
jgi:hypothetical protein